MKGKSVSMMVVAIALLLAGLPAFAKGNKEDQIKEDLLIGNGTGDVITTLLISPTKKKFPNNENRVAFQGLAINDKATFAVLLPEQLKGVDTFDVEIICDGGKRYVTKKGVNINFKSGKLPTLELSRNGKDSTRALIGAAAGGVGGAAAATALSGTITGIIFETFAGAVLGPSVCLLTVPVAIIPVALGAGGYLIGRALTPGGLNVQVSYN